MGFYIVAVILCICGIIFAFIPKVYGLGREWGDGWYCSAITCMVLMLAFIVFGVRAQTEQKLQESVEAGDVICTVKTVDEVFDKAILTKENYETFANGEADFLMFSYEGQPVVVNVSDIEYVKVLKRS